MAERSAGLAGHRDKRSWSALAALLYLALALVLPGLHLAFHRDDHTHEGGGQHATTAFLLSQQRAGRSHAHGTTAPHTHRVSLSDGDEHARTPTGRAAVLPTSADCAAPPDLLHGAGSAAHFQSSLLSGTAHVILPLAGLLGGEQDPHDPPPALTRSALLSALHARAPPTTSAS